MPDRQFYLSKAQALCHDFSTGSPPSKLASHFVSHNGIAYEHGPDNIATLPFLGKSFIGTNSIIEYFEMISKYLRVVDDSMQFSEWTCDVHPDIDDDVGENVKAVVTTRGRAHFEYVSTGKG